MKKPARLIIATILMCSFAISAFSQKVFIEFLDKSKISLTTEQISKIYKTENTEYRENVKLVKVNELDSILKKNILNLNLPYYSCDLAFKYKSSNYINKTDFSWYGELSGDGNSECEIGSILYVKKDKKIHGQIEVGNDVYEFIDIGDGIHLFYKYTEKAFEGICGITDKIGRKTNEDTKNAERSSCPGESIVNILVLFSLNANNAVADIDAVVQLSMQQLEGALNNSAVNPAQLNVNLVDVLQFNFTETSDIFSDIEELSTNINAQNLRQTNEADLVVLLTDGDYGPILGVVPGIGPSFADAYAIVEVDKATSHKTYAHEIGHLFGGRHDVDPIGTIEHGYTFKRWFLGKRRGTILAVLGSISGKPDRRILHYSNPDVEWRTENTGTHSENDNETHFENNGLTIAEFFPNNLPDFNVSIDGKSTVCVRSSNYYEAVITCGTTPYSFSWELSDDGINWNTISTTEGTDLTLTGQYPIGTYLTLRLTVNDNDGATIIRQKGITVIQGTKEECLGVVPLKFEAKIHPNPTTNNSAINITFEKEISNINIQLIDVNGFIVLDIERRQSMQENIPIGHLNLRTGLYYLKVTSKKGEVIILPIQIQN